MWKWEEKKKPQKEKQKFPLIKKETERVSQAGI